MNLVHWPLMSGLLHLVQRGGDWAGPQPAQAPPRCTKCNSSAINVLLYNLPLFCGFDVPVKGLTDLNKFCDVLTKDLVVHTVVVNCFTVC